MSSDIENATSLDLVLLGSDTDLNVPWRALFRSQTIAELGNLESRIGGLTDRGEDLLRDVIEGRAPVTRFGSSVEGPEDSRTQLQEDFQTAIRFLGRTYAQFVEEQGAAKAARVLTFRMQPIAIQTRQATTPMRLAASTNVERETKRWVVEIPERGHLEARVDHHFADDELLFVIENVVEEPLGLGLTAWVAVWSDRLSEPVTSDAFHPKTDRQVVIGKGLEVFPREITRLEFRLADET